MPVDACFASLLADPRVELRRLSPRTTLAELRVAANRFQAAAVGPPLAGVDEVVLSGPGGRPLAGRRYRPVVDEARPGILYCHGGGFVFGNLDTHDAICRQLATSSGCTVLAIDYRLAPEHPFPAALDDCLAAAWHLQRFPEEFALTPAPLGIAGDSAGGHLAIGTVLAGAAAGLRFGHLGLLYPVIDARCDTPSMQRLASGYMLTREAMQWFWECYAPTAEQRLDHRVDLLQADLSGLPFTDLVLAEFDPLHDEGEAFAHRLSAAKGRVAIRRYEGMIHGFAGMPQLTPTAVTAVEALGQAAARQLRPAVRQDVRDASGRVVA